MKRYRIIQYDNSLYAVQKRMRLFGFGPKIWYTYIEWPAHYCDIPGYTLIKCWGEKYEYLDDAMKIVEQEQERDKYGNYEFDKYKVVKEI